MRSNARSKETTSGSIKTYVKRQPSPRPRRPSVLPPHRKNRHYKPDQSRRPSQTRPVAPSLLPISVQPLASPTQSRPRGVCT
jgi:hypothetical protein